MNASFRTNDLLRQARLERGWTQRRLADEVGADDQTVRSWERGRRTPSLEFRSRLCETLQKTPEQLGLVSKQEPQLLSTEVEVTAQAVVQSSLSTPSYPVRFDRDYIVLNRGDQNRQRMIQRVHLRWISGVLDRVSRIPLGLQEKPDAVESPWRLKMQETFSPQQLAVGTHITDVYDDADGELLILGEPGAGKTILLLELARDLIERARLDEAHPIPVLFDLSSWAEIRQPLIDWMEQELNTTYQIPRKLAATWIAADQILPLLDGLDEMVEVHRAACVEAINAYRGEHGLVSIVVCSRYSAYIMLPVRIILSNAVVIQPLTASQIDEYVFRTGESLAAMRVALQSDVQLQEMASTPFMLSILAHSYQGIPIEEMLAEASLSERRRIVFEQYVKRVLSRHGPDKDYTLEQIQRRLKWLARQLVQRNQTEFFVERIQPDWLVNETLRQNYRRTVVRVVYGIESVLIASVFAWLRGGRIGNASGVGAGLLGWLGGGPGNNVLGWMAPGLGGGLEGGGTFGLVLAVVNVLLVLLVGVFVTQSRTMQIYWPWTRRSLSSALLNGLKGGFLVGVLSGVLFGLNGGFTYGVGRGLSYGLFCSLIIGLLSGLVVGLRSDTLRLDQAKAFSTFQVHRRDRLGHGLFIGLWVWLSFGLINSLLVGIIQGVTYGAILGLLFFVVFGLVNGTELIPGLGAEIWPAEIVTWSWQNVRATFRDNLRKGCMVGLSILPGVVLMFGLASALFHGIQYGVRYGLVYGPIVGLIVAVASILAGVINSGWSSNLLDEQHLNRPNEGIYRSLRNGLIAGSLFGPIGGLASGAIVGFAFGLVGMLTGWPILGIGFAIVFTIIISINFALMCGGIAYIEHYVLRWYLWREKDIPWNFVRFLDYASERMLMRKVGGGYIFIHRLLMDYFAALDTDVPDSENASDA